MLIAVTVPVLARRALTYAGCSYAAGDLVPMVPLDALAAARQHLVTLDRHAQLYRTRALAAAPPVVIAEPEPPAPRRRRRRKKAEEEPCASSV